jgi:GntR family transcriptional regulator
MMADKEKSGYSPKYRKMKETLLDSMQNASEFPDGCLPSERELGEKFNVSRITVRRAIAELEQEGYLYRIQGKGAFVCNNKIPQPLARLTSFSSDMAARSMRPNSRILAMEKITAGENIAAMLQVKPEDTVVLLKRLRMADGEPMAIETCYMNNAIGSVVVEHISNETSLYELFTAKLGIVLFSAQQSIEVISLKEYEKSLLKNESESSALFIKRLTFDDQHRPVEYVESKYRGDRYRFQVELTFQVPKPTTTGE